ncbi:DNA-directed RNA polymerase I subunit RPA49 [Parasteatoda tepidariorum]|nr:DNA-directed RNA polymerase I subunit RPA49 [Parasteatoda tepidariorum]
MEQPDEVKLKFSSKIGKKAPVFIAEFTNGRVDADSKIQFESFILENRESMIGSGDANRKLMANNGRLSYLGSSRDASALQYFVGVRNKNTGKMKLYDSTRFILKPVITSKDAIVSENTNAEKNYWEDRNKLTQEFGGKTQKRILKARLKLDVKTDSLEELANDDSVSASPQPPDPFANSPQTVSYLPPANRNAQSLDEVFDINDIISPEIEASLRDHADSWLETYETDKDTAKQHFCKFVLERIEGNLQNPEKLKYLLYYNHLVTFSQLTYADIRKKDPAPLIPEPLKGSMIRKFTLTTKTEGGRTSRSFPPQQKDKLIANLIVLALLIDNYCAHMPHILMDLKRVTPKHFTNIAQTLGCFITSQKLGDQSEKFVQLKLPLNIVLPKYTKRQF